MERKVNKQMKPQMKNKITKLSIIILFVVIVVIAVSAGFIWASYRPESPNQLDIADINYDFVVFSINDEPVTFREFNQSVLHVRSRVLSYFIVAGVDTSCPDFWHTPIDGRVPVDELKLEAIDRSARIKVLQMYARNLGLMDDISYDAFLQGFEDENQRRIDTLHAGGIIFGPQQYNEMLFFDIRAADTEDAVRRALAPTLSATDDELYELFLAEWQETPAESGWLFVEQLTASFMPDGYLFSHEAKTLMESVFEQARLGACLIELAESSNYLYFESRFLGLRRGEGNVRTRAAIQTGREMQVGEISEVFQDQNSWAIISLVDRNEEAYLDFDDLWVIMQRTQAERRFIEYINGLVEAAEIIIKQDTADTVTDLLSRVGE